MTETTDQKAARLLREDRVEPQPAPVQHFRVVGDTGTYHVIVGAHIRTCTCESGLHRLQGSGADDCSHVKAVVKWALADVSGRSSSRDKGDVGAGKGGVMSQSGGSEHFMATKAEDSETCIKHPGRKPIAYSVMCRECYDHERKFAEAATRLLEAVEGALSREGLTTSREVLAAKDRLWRFYDAA